MLEFKVVREELFGKGRIRHIFTYDTYETEREKRRLMSSAKRGWQ